MATKNTKKTTTTTTRSRSKSSKPKSDLQLFTALVKRIQKLERGETNAKRVDRLKRSIARSQEAIRKAEERVEKANAKRMERVAKLTARLEGVDGSAENIATMKKEAKALASKLGF